MRSAKEAFSNVPAMKIKGEMLELAEHIINTKRGKFDASKFDDCYEVPSADIVKAKLDGKKIEVAQGGDAEKVVDLMAALRESARPWREEASDYGNLGEDDTRLARGMCRGEGESTVAIETYRKKRALCRDTRAEADVRARPDSFVIQSMMQRACTMISGLEMGGVLKSWAVIAKGPSLIPGEKRLAVDVEDHRAGVW